MSITLNGNYTDAEIKTDHVDDTTIDQLQTLVNHEAFTNPVKVMPDAHAGAGAVIGFTMKVDDKVCPNTVGVDIGCGMYAVKLTETVEPRKFVIACNDVIPMGRNVHNEERDLLPIEDEVEKICDKIDYSFSRAKQSIGTLGGGNHFIELAEDEDENQWIVIHSGSRGFGFNVSQYHQEKAVEQCSSWDTSTLTEKEKEFVDDEQIDYESIRDAYSGKNIEQMIDRLNNKRRESEQIDEDLAYLTGEDAAEYKHDMRIAQRYASLNRGEMMGEILYKLGVEAADSIQSPHNFISPKDNIVRKGATPAREGQRGIVPFNMADGSIIIKGKGNPDWNYSAPHGAGRVMSRNEAYDSISVTEFQQRMEDVFSININSDTLDEAPQAYKNISVIMDVIDETAEVVGRLTPVANVKADE